MERKKYEKEVWERLVLRLKAHYGSPRFILVVAVLNAAVFLLTYIISLFIWGLDSSVQYLMASSGVVFVELIIFAFVAFDWGYNKIPEEIYNEQNKLIGLFWPDALQLAVRELGLYKGRDRNNDNKKVDILVLEIKNLSQKKKITELEAEIKTMQQTLMDSDESKYITLPHIPQSRLQWEGGESTANISPDGKINLYLAFQDTDSPLGVCFGEGFTHQLFSKESMFQIGIQFKGKFEGENDYRYFHDIQVVYFNPDGGVLLFGEMAQSRYRNLPDQMKAVMKAKQGGYWTDISSPYYDQQLQKQREERT